MIYWFSGGDPEPEPESELEVELPLLVLPPIGLLHLQLSKNLCRAKTVGVGRIPHRLEKASSMGADAIIRIDDDNYQECDHRYIDNRNDFNCSKSIAEILQFTAGKGADIVIIATNNPAALDFALKIASKNSKINIFFRYCQF